jgi:hypothetical protein
MSKPDYKLPATSADPLEIRPLSDAEIEALKKILGARVKRKHLVYWLTQAIRDVVVLSSQPPARERRDDFRRIAKEGRHWVRGFKMSPDLKTLQTRARLEKVEAVVIQFCENVESLARDLEPAIKRGTRIPFALETFIDRMIGVAKVARVRPSIPRRVIRSQTAPRRPPVFFQLIQAALELARDVISSSQISSPVKNAALETIRKRSDYALVEILVGLRGRIGNYRVGPHGVTEWNEWQRRRRSPRKKKKR